MHIEIILDLQKNTTRSHESVTIAENRPFAPEFQSSVDVAKQALLTEMANSSASINGKLKDLNSAIEAAG